MVITIILSILFLIPQAWSEDERPQDFKTTGLLSLDYLNWQEEGSIKSGGTKSRILTTNQAPCLGGAFGAENTKFRVFIDGCFFYGYGKAGSEKNNITYNQSDIETYGVKTSMGIGKFVSSSRTELGFKVPIMLVHQSLDRPGSSKIRDPEPLLLMASVYSRWHFEKFFVQTEFSKFIGNDLTMFSIGAGREF